MTKVTLKPTSEVGGLSLKGEGGGDYYLFGGTKGRKWRPYIANKKPKMALISDYLTAGSSSHASADALAIINIGWH